MEHETVRPYVPGDAADIVELSLRAWEPVFASFRDVLGPGLYDRMFPDWRTQQAASVGHALDQNETWVAGDEDGEALTGFVNLTFDADEATGEIYMIAVDPEHQRQGIATTLTDFALAEMRRRAMTLATVGTGGDPGHAAARFTYEKAGFTSFPQVLYYKLLVT